MTPGPAEPAGAGSAVLKPAAALLGTALVFFFFSELFFFNEFAALPLAEGPMSTAFEHSAAMTGFYILIALPFLTALAWFDVRTLSGLFLAGCLYGWACEGTVIPQVYEAPPFSFLWTAISWHGMVDTLIAFWLIPRALSKGWGPTLLMSAAVGTFWGYWLTWPAGTPEALSPDMAPRYLALSSLPFGLGVLCLGYAGRFTATFPKKPGLIASLCLLPLAAMMGSAAPLAALALAALVLLTLAALRREHRFAAAPLVPYPTPAPHWLGLFLIPGVALQVFLFVTENAMPTAAEFLLPLIAFGGGAVFLLALAMRFWPTRPQS